MSSIVPQQTTPPRPDTPRDCVREYPSLKGASHVELKAFDWKGEMQYSMDLPIADDVQGWARSMLSRCRKVFPRPLQLVD